MENLVGHCQVQEIDEEQQDEEEIIEINDANDDDNDMVGNNHIEIPTSKSRHKVPKTFNEKKPTETVKIRKGKLPEGNGDEQ